MSITGYSDPIRTLRMVRVTGFEPAASCSQSRRATNCATPGYLVFSEFPRVFPKQARYHLRYTRLFGFYPAGHIHPKQPRDHRCRSPAFLRPCASCSVAGSPISIMDCRGKVNLRLPPCPRAEKQNPPPAGRFGIPGSPLF